MKRNIIRSIALLSLILPSVYAGKDNLTNKKDQCHRDGINTKKQKMVIACPIKCPSCKNTFSYNIYNDAITAPGVISVGSIKCKGCCIYFTIEISFNGDVTII